MKPEKHQAEHEWLQQLVGEWQCEMPYDESGKTHMVTEIIRPIGDLWIQMETNGKTPSGTPFTSQLTLGFDPKKGKFVGSWIGSPMSYLWVYEGTLNESKTRLTLNSEGPMPDGENVNMVKVKEIIEIRGPNERTFSSSILGNDGEWKQLFITTSRRVGANSTQVTKQGLVPHIVVKDAAAAIEFYAKAFGAKEVVRVPAPDGKRLWHAELQLNDARLFLRDEFEEECNADKIASPKTLGGTAGVLHLNVKNCDEAYERAIAAGATSILAPWDAFWGDRYAQVIDPFGHCWSMSHPLPKTQG